MSGFLGKILIRVFLTKEEREQDNFFKKFHLFSNALIKAIRNEAPEGEILENASRWEDIGLLSEEIFSCYSKFGSLCDEDLAAFEKGEQQNKKKFLEIAEKASKALSEIKPLIKTWPGEKTTKIFLEKKIDQMEKSLEKIFNFKETRGQGRG